VAFMITALASRWLLLAGKSRKERVQQCHKMHCKLTFIFKLTNATNWNCYVISVILLQYDIDVTVQRNCTLHVLYSEMTWIKSAATYEFGLFGLIISHCNAKHKCECSLCDVLFHTAKYDFVVFYFVRYKNISQILHYTSWSLIIFKINVCWTFILLI